MVRRTVGSHSVYPHNTDKAEEITSSTALKTSGARSHSQQVKGREGVWAVVWVGEPSTLPSHRGEPSASITLVTKEKLQKHMWSVQGEQGARVSRSDL